jgi:CheY-like chemotaxis protein
MVNRSRPVQDGVVLLQDTFPQPVRILLVEDDAVQTLFVKAALAALPQLELAGVARDGFEAVDFVRRSIHGGQPLPDVILLDLNMPNMDGFEVLAELKSAPRLRRVPIVVFSTSDDQGDIDRAYEQGANSYVVKPARLDELKHSLALVAGYWATAARLPSRVAEADRV